MALPVGGTQDMIAGTRASARGRSWGPFWERADIGSVRAGILLARHEN